MIDGAPDATTTPKARRRPRGSGGITFDDVRGQWRLTWQVRGDPKTRRKWVDGSYSDAGVELNRQLALAAASSARVDHRMTVDAWLTKWLDSHVAAKSLGTQAQYRSVTENHLRKPLGSIKLGELNDLDIAALKASLIRGGRTPRAADAILAVLSAALGQAKTSGLITVNPRAAVARERKTRRVVDPPSREEVDKILAAVADGPPRWLALYGLTCGHGLRESEVLGLRHGDRSRDGIRLTVQRKRECRTGSLAEEPKDGSVRSFDLLPWVAEAIDALGVHGPEELMFPAIGVGNRKNPDATLNPKTLLNHVAGLSKELGLRRIYTWHDLRRAYGTRLAAKGNSASAIQAAMGHLDYRTSLLYIAPADVIDDLAPPPRRGTSGALTGALRERQERPAQRERRSAEGS